MRRLTFIAMLVVASLPETGARGATPPDPAMFAYQQKPGTRLPVRLVFRDVDGSLVRLGDLSGGQPIILVLAYFHCPNLCGLVREDLFHALGAAKLRAGRDYALVVVSIDPKETTFDAKAAKTQDMAAHASPGADRFWHYLTGSANDVQAVADAVGFRDRLDEQTKQFVHPAGIVFVTPAGVVSSYLLGVGYTPTDVRSAVERADAGAISAVGSTVLLLCFDFDPTTGRYSLAIMKLLRLAGALTAAVIAATLFLLFRRERSRA